MLIHLYELKNGQVYWNGGPVKQADSSSFQALGGPWGRDASHVFVQGTPRRGLDLATFELLNPVYAKDAHSVYDWEGTIKDADPATFKVLDPGIVAEESISTKFWFRGYARDAKAVYYHDQMVGRATRIRGADLESFVSLRNDYGFDEQGVWCQKTRLPKADPSTWIYLGRLWSRDDKRMYYAEREVRDIDQARFSIVNAPTIGSYALDGRRYFFSDREITEDKFWSSISADFASFEQWFQVARQRI